MIDVNLMCPIPLLIFLIRGKECFICREGDEVGLPLCCPLGLENLIAHQESLLTWGQKVTDPKLGTLVSSWEWLCLYLLPQIICMSKLFFLFLSVGLVFAGTVKLGSWGRLQIVATPMLGVHLCHGSKEEELKWQTSGKREREPRVH